MAQTNTQTNSAPLVFTPPKQVMRVKNLSWGPNIETPLLHNISFDIQQHKILGIVGANGAGKSSLLRCLYRVHKPNKGQVLFDTQNIWHMSAQQFAQKVAVVLQESPAEFALNVRQIIEMGRTPYYRMFGGQSQNDIDIIDSTIQQLSLESFEKRLFLDLSGGEKQRVYLARALVQQPEIMILDEPTNHLDIRHQLEIMQMIANLGITIIITLHDLNIAANYCDRILLLNQGQVLAHGHVDKVLTPTTIKQAYGVNCTVSENKPLKTKFFQYTLD